MMNINPLFLNSLGSQAIETDLKNKKFDAPAYLFSDIIKIYTEDKNTDLAASVNTAENKSISADGSEEVVDLNSLFEQVNKKVDSPFSENENTDVSDVNDSNVTVFKYVFEELNSSTSIDSAGELKLADDGSTHISDVDINTLVSNIINLIQNSGIAASIDNNFNIDSINTFLSNGENVDLNIETSDGVIKLSFEQNGSANSNVTNNFKLPSVSPSTNGDMPVAPPDQESADSPVESAIVENTKQMSLKISVYKDTGKQENTIPLNNGTDVTSTINTGANDNTFSEIPSVDIIENNAAYVMNNSGMPGHIQHPNISSQDISENSSNSKTAGSKNIENQSNVFQISEDSNTSVNNTDIKLESEVISKDARNKESEKTELFISTLAEDKNITEISYKEEKTISSGMNETNIIDSNKEAGTEFTDLPLFAESGEVDNKQPNISQTTNVSAESTGKAGLPETIDTMVNNSNQIVTGELDVKKQPVNIENIKTSDNPKDLQNAGVEPKTTKTGITDELMPAENNTASVDTIKEVYIEHPDTKDTTVNNSNQIVTGELDVKKQPVNIENIKTSDNPKDLQNAGVEPKTTKTGITDELMPAENNTASVDTIKEVYIEHPDTKDTTVNNSNQIVTSELDVEKQSGNIENIMTSDNLKELNNTGADINTAENSVSEKLPTVEKNTTSVNIITQDKDTVEVKPENQKQVNSSHVNNNKPGEVINKKGPEIQDTGKAEKNIDDDSDIKGHNSSTSISRNINAAVKNFINNVIKGKETVTTNNVDDKPVLQTNSKTSDITMDNIGQSKNTTGSDKAINNSESLKSSQTDAGNGKPELGDTVDIQPKMQTESKNAKFDSEIIEPAGNNTTVIDSKHSVEEVKTTRQYDIKLNGARRMSSVDLLSKVHKFISDNTFAEKQASTDTDIKTNTAGTDNGENSSTYLNSLNEFTKSADISMLNNKSNFVLQKQNYKDHNISSLKNIEENSADTISQQSAEVKTETVHISAENVQPKKKDTGGISIKDQIKVTEEDKILTAAEEKIQQNQPVNEKKVFTPDFSLVNPLGARESGKVEVTKNGGSNVKVNEVSENSTKNVEKNNSDNNTSKENRENGNNTSFTLNHSAPDKIIDKANSIREEMKFTLPDEKVVKYSKLMPEIKNILSEGVNKSLTISLTPEELGKVKLIVETVDKTVSAKIEVQNEAVQTTVQNNLDNLKQSLSQSGLNINNITVSISYNDNKQQKPGELKKKHNSGDDKKIETEEEKISSKNTSKTLGYNTYEYLA